MLAQANLKNCKRKSPDAFLHRGFAGGDGEIRTLARFEAPTAFRVRTLQPLGYISKHQIRYCYLRFTLFSSVENSDEIT